MNPGYKAPDWRLKSGAVIKLVLLWWISPIRLGLFLSKTHLGALLVFCRFSSAVVPLSCEQSKGIIIIRPFLIIEGLTGNE
jgi:hypothetical protein